MAEDETLQGLDASIALSTELHAASSAGDIAKCKELVDNGALAWVQDEIGWSALHFAAGMIHTVNEVFILLILACRSQKCSTRNVSSQTRRSLELGRQLGLRTTWLLSYSCVC